MLRPAEMSTYLWETYTAVTTMRLGSPQVLLHTINILSSQFSTDWTGQEQDSCNADHIGERTDQVQIFF